MIVIIKATITKEIKQFPNIFSAVLLSFFPIKILARGAPPTPNKYAVALIIIIIGKQTPTPVNAADPISGICPIYIRSTMLYNVLTIIPIIAGTENCINNFEIFSSPKSFCLFIHFILLI